MSILTKSIDGPQGLWTAANRSFSPAAHRVLDLLDKALSSQTSVVLGERYRALGEAVAEASVLNWDGHGAQPTDYATFQKAWSFLRALPTAIPDPEIVVEPSGHIAFEWYRGPRRVFTLSVGADGDLSYAILIGRERTYGSGYFIEDIPQPLAYLLSQFLDRKS